MQDHTPNLIQPQLPFEEWRDVPGYEGLYQVSNLGQVRRLERRITTKRGHVQTHHAKLKTLGIINGYHYLWLFKENKGRRFLIHALVALAFIGPRPKGYDIHHINKSRTDNRPDNLQYLSQREHDSLHNRGEAHKSAKIKESDVIQIRNLYPAIPIHIIAKRLSLPYHAVWFAAHRKTWKHIP